MRTSLLRANGALALVCAGLTWSPPVLLAQEEHAEEAAAAEHQEHAEHAELGKNEIALFVGGTRRLKFEEDETGGTMGLEYARLIAPRTLASIGAEWATGNIERDWIAMLKLGIQPFEGVIRPLYFYIGAGIEVARIDEVLLAEDEELGEVVVPHETGDEHTDEHATEGEHFETEVDALMRLGAGWPFHVGNFSIIPTINTDIVGEDWSLVGGIILGYRF